jgi:hypothetical protein
LARAGVEPRRGVGSEPLDEEGSFSVVVDDADVTAGTPSAAEPREGKSRPFADVRGTLDEDGSSRSLLRGDGGALVGALAGESSPSSSSELESLDRPSS